MRLSTKTEYGIRALVHLAENLKECPYSITDISEKEGISFSFLEKIFADFKRAGIVTSQRGAQGGYILAKAIEDISIKEIVELLDGGAEPFKSLVDQDKSPKIHCKSHLMLSLVQNKISDALAGVSLADISNKQLVQ